MNVLAHPVHLMVRLDGEPVRVVEKQDTVVAGIYNVVEYVSASALEGAVEALREYGRHRAGCSGGIHGDTLSCACGLSDAITVAGGP